MKTSASSSVWPKLSVQYAFLPSSSPCSALSKNHRLIDHRDDLREIDTLAVERHGDQLQVGHGVAEHPGRPTQFINRSSGHCSGALKNLHQRRARQGCLEDLERVVIVHQLDRLMGGQDFLGLVLPAFLPLRRLTVPLLSRAWPPTSHRLPTIASKILGHCYIDGLSLVAEVTMLRNHAGMVTQRNTEMTLLQRHFSQNVDKISASVRQSRVQTLKTRNNNFDGNCLLTLTHQHVSYRNNMRCGFPAVVVFVVVVLGRFFHNVYVRAVKCRCTLSAN